MPNFIDAISAAIGLILSGDGLLFEIGGLSLWVTFWAVSFAALVGMPVGAFLAITRFPGHGAIVVTINALMGLPPVVVGLVLYMLLSQAGPLAVLQLLYTPTAMILAQFILVTPIIAALTFQAVTALHTEFAETLQALRANRRQTLLTLLWEARPALFTALLAGLGRAFAEVGAVMIVGGNINHVTRVMTTAIALETSKGELVLALGLGIILLLLSLGVNALAQVLRPNWREYSHG